MDPADRIPEDLEGFTAAEAVAVLGRRQPVPTSLLADLRQRRIQARERHHLDQIDDLQHRAEQCHGAPWLRAQENITRHLTALDYLKGLTP